MDALAQVSTPFAALLLVLGVILYHFVFRPAFVSSLNKVPNAHWSCGFSPFWILRRRFLNDELQHLFQIHKILGPVIRVAPQELSVSCIDSGIRKIYDGGFDKPGYYEFFNYYDRSNSFSSLDRRSHALHRKRMASAYTKSTLFKSAQLQAVTTKVLYERFLPILEQQASSPDHLELLELSYSLSLDLVNSFIFGVAGGSNFLEGIDRIGPWLVKYEQRYCQEGFWVQELPMLTKLLGKLGVEVLPQSHFEGASYLESWVLRMCDRAEQTMVSLESEDGSISEGDVPAVYQQVRSGICKDLLHTSTSEQRLELATELFDHLSGAREVLGLVLGYTLYYVARNPHAQHRLREELLSHPILIRRSDDVRKPDLHMPKAMDDLPYLKAVIQESLRLRPNSTPLPRITPHDRSVKIGDYDNIPPNTRVNAFQWFIHRDEERWGEDVNEFKPERWFEEVEGSTKGEPRKKMLWAFASGPRMCVGSHLSLHWIRYILATVFTNFELTAVEDGSYGQYPPGSLEDKLKVRLERLGTYSSNTPDQ